MTKRKVKLGNRFIFAFFVILCLMMVYPFWCIISVSLTSGEAIAKYGFTVIPKEVDLAAYKYLFDNPKAILSAYGTTLLVTVVGTLIGCVTESMYAYVVSRLDFPLRKLLSFIAIFVMFFNGGMAAQYIVYVSWLNLKNSIWVLIFPVVAGSVMNIIIMRAYFQQLPFSMVESAKIDGASEYTIFCKLMMPLSKPAVATIFLTLFVTYWNAYYESMMYMDSGHYTTIQLLLQRMLAQVEFMKEQAALGGAAKILADLPDESLRMATCVLTVLPMTLVFPKFQKYFVKGMAIGAVKE